MTSKVTTPTKKAAAAAKATTTKAAGSAKATTAKAANTAKASLPFELPKFELPKFEFPKIDLPKVQLPKVDLLNLNVGDMVTGARTRVETRATDVRNSVNHGVTLLREVVGL